MTSTFDDAGPAGLLGYRPVAGLRTTDGRRLADGALFRSCTPQFVDDAAAQAFVDRVGLHTILDLRLPHEVANEGSGGFADTAAQIVNIPFAVRKTVSADSAVAPMLGPDPLVGTYLTYLSDDEAFVRLVGRLLDDGTPALVHCTVGKDRTGVATAILLDALTVLRRDIAADYASKSADVAAMMHKLRGMKSYGDAVDVYPPEAYGADPTTILRFLAWVDLLHGGARAYLLSAGITDSQLNELSDRLFTTDKDGKMSQVNRASTVDASPEEVWAIVGDVAAVHTWVPAITATRMDGDVRVVRFADGAEGREQITAHSDADRTYSYTYLGGPIPLEEYASTLIVGPARTGGGSLISWNATLQADPAVVESIEGLYDSSLATLKTLVDGE